MPSKILSSLLGSLFHWDFIFLYKIFQVYGKSQCHKSSITVFASASDMLGREGELDINFKTRASFLKRKLRSVKLQYRVSCLLREGRKTRLQRAQNTHEQESSSSPAPHTCLREGKRGRRGSLTPLKRPASGLHTGCPGKAFLPAVSRPLCWLTYLRGGRAVKKRQQTRGHGVWGAVFINCFLCLTCTQKPTSPACSMFWLSAKGRKGRVGMHVCVST